MIIRKHKPEPLTLPVAINVKGNRPKSTGLGDRVERIAQPIARVIDKVAGTNIQGCGACKKRREALNKAFPLN